MSALTSLYRLLAHHRLFALLNIGGLALGIATFLVLFLFVQFETGYDRVLPQQDRLWVIEERYVMPGYPADTNPNTMGSELKILRADYPQLVGTRYMNMAATVQQGGQATAEDLGTVDPNFFDLMRFPAVEGDPTATLADPNGLVVTQKTARKYFGSQSAIGRTLQLSIDGTTYRYKVGAVLRDMPDDVTFKSEMFAQLSRTRFGNEWWEHWGSASLTTFLRFPDAAAARAFEAQLPAFLDRHAYAGGNLKKGEYFQSLRPLTAMHLYSPGDRAIVTTLGAVGLLTLLIAIVNYVNLATARAGLRAREVAMRKVLGGTRRSLIRQFLGEALATVAVAALIGLALAEIALPFVNALGGTSLAIRYVGWDGVVLPLVLLVLSIALVAGLYPAFVLSGFRPAAVLASTRAPGGGRSGTRLRSALVVVQFAIAIAFAIATGVMLKQTEHIRDADLGFRRDGLMIVRSLMTGGIDSPQRAAILRSLAAAPGVTGVTVANNAPGDQSTTNFSGYSRAGASGAKISLMDVGTGRDYFRVYGARLVAGRLFDAAHADDRGLLTLAERKRAGPNVVINRTAVTALGFASPTAALGQAINDGERDATIIGVVDDLRFRSPRDPVTPVAYTYNTVDILSPFAAVRYAGADAKTMMTALEAAWKRVVPGVPFEARSVEDNLYQRYYKADAQRSRLFTIGAVLAILIGCIGLYGLAAFDTARRVKEIGIRKTLGASTTEVMRLLIGQFMRPVVLANLVAWPLAYVAMQRWLGGFDDRIALSPLFFVGASLAAVLIASTTVFGQGDRTARIIGVVGDMRFATPREPLNAVSYSYRADGGAAPVLVIRTNSDVTATLARVELVWRRLAPNVPSGAITVDQKLYDSFYRQDVQRSRLFTIGAVLAVAIGCLGLYGLAAFDTMRRVKEIGIRKALGASTSDVMRLLLVQFLKPVFLANVIAWPIAWFAMSRWLGGFDDRIVLSSVYFVAASVLALVIAASTVASQAWRVARAEPARALRQF